MSRRTNLLCSPISDSQNRLMPVTPIQGPIFLKNNSVPVVPLYAYPKVYNGTFMQIPVSIVLTSTRLKHHPSSVVWPKLKSNCGWWITSAHLAQTSLRASHVLLCARQFVYTTNRRLQRRQKSKSMTYCGLYLDILRNVLCGGEIMSIQQGSEKFQTQK